MKFHEIIKEKGIFELWPIFVTLTLEVGIYKWYATHRLVMMHVSMKFYEILYLFSSCDLDKEKGIFDIWPLLVTLNLEVGTYKWHTTHRLMMMMHVSMMFHEILKEKGVFDRWPLLVTLILEVGTCNWYVTHRLVMMHVFMKCHEIIFKHLEVMVQTSK